VWASTYNLCYDRSTDNITNSPEFRPFAIPTFWRFQSDHSRNRMNIASMGKSSARQHRPPFAPRHASRRGDSRASASPAATPPAPVCQTYTFRLSPAPTGAHRRPTVQPSTTPSPTTCTTNYSKLWTPSNHVPAKPFRLEPRPSPKMSTIARTAKSLGSRHVPHPPASPTPSSQPARRRDRPIPPHPPQLLLHKSQQVAR